MSKFANLKELFSMLRREEKILTDFFQKRKLAGLKYDYVVDILEDDDERLRFLVNKEVVRENSGSYELDGLFLNFFEQVLDTNEEINVAYINENIETIKQNISYYANDKSETKRREYLRKIKNTLRNIANITIRNIISLKRNVDNTYKNEANYKNKKLKLQNFDKKSNDINTLITQTENLVDEQEQLFFNAVADDELNNIIIDLKINLDKSKHNLIEIKKQIINFLNQIQAQNVLIEKLHKIKYLKDQVTLKSSTDIEKVLSENNAVVFESLPQYPLKLSLDYLQTDESAHDTILKIAARKKSGVKIQRPVADEISSEYLNTQPENEIIINLESIMNGFRYSGYKSLWDYAESYNYPKEVSFEDMVLIFCQIVSLYENELTITDDFQEKNGVKIAIVTKS